MPGRIKVFISNGALYQMNSLDVRMQINLGGDYFLEFLVCLQFQLRGFGLGFENGVWDSFYDS